MNVFIRSNFNSKIVLGHLIRTIRIAKIIEKIGNGAFGEVYKGININTKKEIAIKFEK